MLKLFPTTQYSLLTFLVLSTTIAAIFGLYIRNHQTSASALRTGCTSTTRLDDGTRIDVSWYGNSVHDPIFISVVERKEHDPVIGTCRTSHGNDPTGLWINDKKVSLGGSILLAYFSTTKEPELIEIPFDRTQELLADLETRYPEPAIKRWIKDSLPAKP